MPPVTGKPLLSRSLLPSFTLQWPRDYRLSSQSSSTFTAGVTDWLWRISDICPNDDGNLIITPADLEAFIASNPQAQAFADRFVKPFLGSVEFINGLRRYCFWLADATPTDIRSQPEVRRRIQAVQTARLSSTRPATRALADRAALFGELRQPSERYLFIPGVSSENRRYVPMAFMEPDVIVSDLARSVSGIGLFEFGVLTSAMHMAWLRNVGGA
jgi:hypothetical protein